MKEKLSESTKTQNLPKVKLALEEEKNRNKPPEAIHLPKPTGWRILVLPFQPKRITKGGVHIADTAAERQHVATVCGLVLELDLIVIEIKKDIHVERGARKEIG